MYLERVLIQREYEEIDIERVERENTEIYKKRIEQRV